MWLAYCIKHSDTVPLYANWVIIDSGYGRAANRDVLSKSVTMNCLVVVKQCRYKKGIEYI